MVSPSCPALIIHDDDAFRRSLVATLDQKHSTVTMVADGRDAVAAIDSRPFHVILVAIDLAKGKGLFAMQHLRANRDALQARIIILGEPNPELRTYAKFADETLMKPVDPNYVADRARTDCRRH